MKKNPFYPGRQGDQAVWHGNFSGKLSALATTLGLTPAQLAAILADCAWMIYILQLWLPAVRAWAKACTDALIEAQTGASNGAQVLPAFVAPPLPTGTIPVNAGALLRIFVAIQMIKDSGKCTDAMAVDLGIVGTVATIPDLTAVQPVLTLSISGGNVHIKWGWGGLGAYLHMLEMQVDRADGKGYVSLVYDTTPNYIDTHAFPTTAAVWTYRAIFHSGEVQVGVWSNPVSIAVVA